jgi:GT2 family glycosyltransferase
VLARVTTVVKGASDTVQLPGVSVVVRSYERRESLLQILIALRSQDHPDFEVIVIEQSGFTPEERAPFDAMQAADPRLHIIYSEPLGVGGAREAGWRRARKEIVLTIDDDDVPLGTDFVSGHARNYLDPSILGVTGRHVYSPDEVCGYHNRDQARRRCLRYNFFGYPHVYCRFDERVDSVDWVHGSGGSLRKAVIERVGGWDAGSTEHDEHPLCLALRNTLRSGERLVFDPSMVLLRRKDIPGGAAVRYDGPHRIYRMWIRYYHGLVLVHRPGRSLVMYPIFPLATTFSAVRFIWKDSMTHSGFADRFAASIKTVTLSPFWYAEELLRLGRATLRVRSARRGPLHRSDRRLP